MKDESFFDSLESTLKRYDVGPQKTLSILAEVWRDWGGQQVYISLRGDILRRAVMANFDGTNAGEVASRFRLSRAQVYKIVKQARKARPKQEQASLLTM